jgi:60 kDa SS-A/Ro ribonucleoprotein
MANKTLFASIVGKLLPEADATNEAGGRAYAMTPRHKLAQLAATGTLNGAFYAEARDQLDDALLTALDVDSAFIAKTAIHARRKGHMKDMPALLVALLSTLQTEDFSKAFPRVIDNGRMLRSFVQMIRSGAVGRRSLGSRPKRLVGPWLEEASDIEIMRAAVGQSPSLADVIKLAHPRPTSKAREALFAYLIGKPYDVAALPKIAQDFEAFKRDPSRAPPEVPFQMLTAAPLSKEQWATIGSKGGWQMLRMNLNTFARHGAFEVKWFPRKAAARLRDKKEIERARVLPYQLMAAHAAVDEKVPRMVREALQDAMEIAVSNAPCIKGRVVICPDVSGSMSFPVTGHRKGATSKIRCIDVAGLVAAAFLRTNREARVLPFECGVVDVDLNPRDTVLTNAKKLASIGGGGTNCSAPLRRLVEEKATVDLVIFVSDNESWIDSAEGGRGTETMRMWQKLKRLNPAAKLVCIDIQPYATMQAVERDDILNIGGFSDAVFEMIDAFATGGLDARHWVGEIEKIDLGD